MRLQPLPVIVAAAIAAAVAGAAAAIAAAVAGAAAAPAASPAATAASPAAPAPTLSLTIDQVGGTAAGTIDYTLTCGPAGGSIPNPPHACAVVAANPSMLVAQPIGLLEPCAYPGPPSFQITGHNAGAPVDLSYEGCSTGQGPTAALWAGLVPTDAQRLAVHPGHGLGIFPLGTPEASIRLALGAGRPATAPCANCTRVYPTGETISLQGSHTFAVETTVTYRRSLAVAFTSTNPMTTVAGHLIQESYGSLAHALAGWRALSCPRGVRVLARGKGPSTELAFLPFYTTVTVQKAAPGCP
jgi:hypothetical protein